MLLDYIKKLEYKSDLERLNTIKQILKSKNIKFIEQNYSYFNFKGTNVIVDIENAKHLSTCAEGTDLLFPLNLT